MGAKCRTTPVWVRIGQLMRLLLDNCVNQRFGRLVSEAECVHVRQLGWAELTNGKLLSAAEEARFDVLLTVDQNVRMQQNLAARDISLITLDARSITIDGLTPFGLLVDEVLAQIKRESLTGQDFVVALPK